MACMQLSFSQSLFLTVLKNVLFHMLIPPIPMSITPFSPTDLRVFYGLSYISFFIVFYAVHICLCLLSAFFKACNSAFLNRFPCSSQHFSVQRALHVDSSQILQDLQQIYTFAQNLSRYMALHCSIGFISFSSFKSVHGTTCQIFLYPEPSNVNSPSFMFYLDSSQCIYVGLHFSMKSQFAVYLIDGLCCIMSGHSSLLCSSF